MAAELQQIYFYYGSSEARKYVDSEHIKGAIYFAEDTQEIFFHDKSFGRLSVPETFSVYLKNICNYIKSCHIRNDSALEIEFDFNGTAYTQYVPMEYKFCIVPAEGTRGKYITPTYDDKYFGFHYADYETALLNAQYIRFGLSHKDDEQKYSEVELNSTRVIAQTVSFDTISEEHPSFSKAKGISLTTPDGCDYFEIHDVMYDKKYSLNLENDYRRFLHGSFMLNAVNSQTYNCKFEIVQKQSEYAKQTDQGFELWILPISKLADSTNLEETFRNSDYINSLVAWHVH